MLTFHQITIKVIKSVLECLLVPIKAIKVIVMVTIKFKCRISVWGKSTKRLKQICGRGCNEWATLDVRNELSRRFMKWDDGSSHTSWRGFMKWWSNIMLLCNDFISLKMIKHHYCVCLFLFRISFLQKIFKVKHSTCEQSSSSLSFEILMSSKKKKK
jgi:hypothetical protein